MAYKPTAADFDIPEEEGYIPSAEDFEEPESYIEPIGLRPRPVEKTGVRGVIHDVGSSLANALKSAKGFVKDIPQMTEDLGGELLEHPNTAPLRGLGQIGAEASEIAKGTVNAPYNLVNYVLRKRLNPVQALEGLKVDKLPDIHSAGDIGRGLPQNMVGQLASALIKSVAQNLPHIPEDTGAEKALGLTPGKGDRLLRGLTDTASIIAGGRPVLKSVKKTVFAPNKEKLFQRALEERINQASEKTKLSEADLQQLQESLRKDYSKIHGKKLGEPTPVSLEEGINVAEHKIEAKRPLTEIPHKEVGEIPSEPDLKAITESKKSALEKAKSEADEALGTLEHPRLKGGSKIKKAIEDVKASASDLYNAAHKHYVGQQISADNSTEIRAATKDLEAMKDADELAPGYGSGSAEQKSLEAQIEALKGEKVNASDIFDLQRTLEKMAEDTRKKQYSGVNQIEFKRLDGIADRLESHADKLAKRLETVGGKDVQKMIIEANKGWRTFKDLEKRNPVGKAALKGEIPMRSMIEIAKAHPGNDFLKALVDSDPELKKHILAAYAGESNANKLLKPTSLVKKYIEELPEVEEHVNSLKQALQGVKEGEIEASRVKKEYDDLVKSMQDAAKEQKSRQDAIKESEELKRQIKFKQDAIPKLEAKIKTVEEHSAEHQKLQKELEEHKKYIQDKGGRLKNLLKFIAKVKLAGKVHL